MCYAIAATDAWPTPAGVHLDADQHRTLGLALAPVVAALL
ncbi:hypothetical protein FHX68_1197 [Microbacterium lacticum]|uniref:Uncharacterized protein n=1 Tax=Microbacterium lacticum TaxID=33885 RepID=A0A543KTY6_9MICO|nr:hypothetical protein FHX68_1197 [Microbacterium lacticum]